MIICETDVDARTRDSNNMRGQGTGTEILAAMLLMLGDALVACVAPNNNNCLRVAVLFNWFNTRTQLKSPNTYTCGKPFQGKIKLY